MKKQLWLGSTIITLVALLLVGQMPTFASEPDREDTGGISLKRLQAVNIGWQQSNISGFGTAANNMISALEVLDGQMYATTNNEVVGQMAQVWRTSDGKLWSQFTPPSPYTTAYIYDAKTFGSYMYIGTYHDLGGEIWRTNGTTWEQVATGGLGDVNNLTFSAFSVYSNMLYVATGNFTTGIEIWRSPTGDTGSWSKVNTDGFGGGVSWDAVVMDTFNGYLYVGIGRNVGGGSLAELWRSNNGTTWTPVFTDGLGDINNTTLAAMAEYEGSFYISMRNLITSGQIWVTTNGTTFTPVTTNGFTVTSNQRPYGLYVFEDVLYSVISNYASGAQVWRTDLSGSWTQIMQGGWGDSNNVNADYLDKAATTFKDALYIGTGNDVTGGQIWKMVYPIYLPLILRQ